MEFVEYIKSPRVDKVLLKRAGQQYVEGTLCVTGHHLIFSSRRERSDDLFLLHSSVEHMKKKFSGQQGMLSICCKNFDLVKFRFNSMEEALNVASSVEVLSVVEDPKLKYPFFYPHPKHLNPADGWNLFSVKEEFSKLSAISPNWRICNVNSEYQVCSSYPAAVIVPSDITDEVILASARFRQGGRFPVLSYFHQASGAALLRCGQPLTTMGGKRSRQDEILVNAVVGKELKGTVVDTRSATAALNSRSRGGGMESDSHYPRWKKVHQNIEKYPVLNDSIAKLIEACFDPKINMNSWFSKLESSGWLDHVQSVLTTACYTAQCLDRQGTAVLVHGDEGTDTTLQVTSLAQVLLDAECRTIKGFESLIDREWLRGGHPFAERCIKVGVSSVRYKGQGPVFLLFLDCVWQVYQQFPCSFEFNEKFLITLFEHAYSSHFGTFLCNNEKQRVEAELHKRTISLWSHLNQQEALQLMVNPMYEPNESVLWPSVASQSLMVWSGLYLKWKKGTKNEEGLWNEVRRIQEMNKELKSKASSLRMEYAELQANVLEERRRWQEEQENQGKTAA